MIRVVVADDHPVVRDGLRALFASVDDVGLVAEASTGHEAVRAAVTEQPDVLIMDLRMPDLDGVAATGQIARLAPGVAVLILTMFDDDDSVFAAMRAGARGYIVKGASQAEILRSIASVANGGAVFGGGVARRILQHFAAPPVPAVVPFPALSAREREVLDLIATGLSNTEIGARLTLAPKTIGNHISAIFTKLQVTSRAQAIVQARDAGLGHRAAPPGPAG
jgi:DNA-binding NarL/FixJ family response regulator